MLKARDTCLSEVDEAEKIFTGIKTRVQAYDFVSEETKVKLAAALIYKREEI